MESSSEQVSSSESESCSSPVHSSENDASMVLTVNFVPPTHYFVSSTESKINNSQMTMQQMNSIPALIPRKKKESKMVFKPFESFIDLEVTVKSLNKYMSQKQKKESNI